MIFGGVCGSTETQNLVGPFVGVRVARTRKWSGPAICQCFQGVSALTAILVPQLIACNNALRAPLCLFVTLNHSCDTGTLRLKPSCTDAQQGWGVIWCDNSRWGSSPEPSGETQLAQFQQCSNVCKATWRVADTSAQLSKPDQLSKRLVDGSESKLRREERTRTSAGHGVYREYRGCHQFVAQNKVVQLIELCALQRRPGASRFGDSRPRCVPRIPEKPRSRCLPMRQHVLVDLDQHSRPLIKFVLMNRVRPNSWALVVRAERSVANQNGISDDRFLLGLWTLAQQGLHQVRFFLTQLLSLRWILQCHCGDVAFSPGMTARRQNERERPRACSTISSVLILTGLRGQLKIGWLSVTTV